MKKIFFTKVLFFIFFLGVGFFSLSSSVKAASGWCLTSENNCIEGPAGLSCSGTFFDNAITAENDCTVEAAAKWCLTVKNTCKQNQTSCTKVYNTEQLCKDVAVTRWCLTSVKSCLIGDGTTECDGTTYVDQSSCIAAVNTATTPSSGSTTTAGTFKEVTDVSLENPIGSSDITQIFGNLIKVALGILGSSALLVFIYGGFMWLVSSGNPERVKKGTSAMVWATIGVVVIFASYAIISLVLQGLGVS